MFDTNKTVENNKKLIIEKERNYCSHGLIFQPLLLYVVYNNIIVIID